MTTIRPGAIDDADALTDLHLATWEEAYTGLIPDDVLADRRTDRPARVARWAQILGTPDHTTLVADDPATPGRLLGFASHGPARDDEAGLPARELWGLYVRAEVYGTGLGEQLMRAAIGDGPAYLWVLKGNTRAIAFYERHGFALDGSRHREDVGVHLRMVRSSPSADVGEGTVRPDHYDGFAEAYARTNETGLFNAHYERPAMLALLGDVAGHAVLDAGCGAGPLAAELRNRGATVSAFDASPAMVELARRRLGEAVDVRVADLGAPLPYADDEFDDVVASLVLHYLPDWTGPLGELRRVLRRGGRLLVSVNHPVIRPIVHPDDDYFEVSSYTEDYEFDGRRVDLTFWHRPLHAMTDAFAGAGLRVVRIAEPPYAPDTPPHLLPPGLGERTAFLCFLFFVLEAA